MTTESDICFPTWGIIVWVIVFVIIGFWVFDEADRAEGATNLVLTWDAPVVTPSNPPASAYLITAGDWRVVQTATTASCPAGYGWNRYEVSGLSYAGWTNSEGAYGVTTSKSELAWIQLWNVRTRSVTNLRITVSGTLEIKTP